MSVERNGTACVLTSAYHPFRYKCYVFWVNKVHLAIYITVIFLLPNIMKFNLGIVTFGFDNKLQILMHFFSLPFDKE